MDTRPPVPFKPRPDTGGRNADYIRAQAETGRGSFIDDDEPDQGPFVIALVMIALGLAVLIVLLIAALLTIGAAS